jgi:hypothetical protein
MIQRIQTFYLFVSLVLGVLMLFSPVSEILADSNKLLVFKSTGLYDAENGKIIIKTIPVIILISVIILLYIVCIFAFKRRVLQARICMLNILLLLGLVGLAYYYLSFIFRKTEPLESSLQLAAIYPVICIILTFLAYRNIRKDEQIVKSIDKIRKTMN